MEDDDYQDVQQDARDVVVVERPKRLTKIERHDGTQAFADAVLEMAQQILDQMPPEYSYKDAATKLKKKLDEEKKGTWHVIVGSHFGANVTNDAETLINFKINEMHFLVFRSGPPERPLDATEEQK
ncbi:putative dynein light chain [Trypanosoma grayi]|uniref:putative dynein light chain n=1 Tax=Trypanosoma grayi TaxID=71804 RepID=UPI0004F48D55|nr:putative dynein light chain [Trypanosoma grayi]KEG10870.1 putative dynein light chain [Trypanosoma grayi]